MTTTLRSSMSDVVRLAVILILVAGLPIFSRQAAAAAEPEAAADSPDQYVWSLVYRIATKTDGEIVAVPGGTPHQIKIFYTFVKEFRVRSDGTFAFEECDFGHCQQVGVQGEKVKIFSRTNWQGLLRGSGKWQPATRDAGESLTLRLEWGAGDGVNETHQDGDDNTSVVKQTVSPDGRTVTTTSKPPGAQPIFYAYPNSFVVSEWVLHSNQTELGDSDGAVRRDKLSIIPVSYLFAPNDECDDDKDTKFQGNRPTTLVCVAGPRTPITESVTVTKRKKEADLAVTFGAEQSYQSPGSNGTVKAVVSNNGPCTVNATLHVRVLAGPGEIYGHDTSGNLYYADSRVDVNSYSGGTSEITVSKTVDTDEYDFTYQFTLSKGAARTVEIKAIDRTKPGQTLPYIILFQADATGDLPDPNTGNDSPILEVTFNPPKNNPTRPTPRTAN